MNKKLLVTGSSGLIGSEVATYFSRELGYEVHGVDNNQRAVFFGPQGDTRWNQKRLASELQGFVHHELDIRDRAGVLALVKAVGPAAIVHTAAQPSHDRAAAIPFDDFDTNAVGTLNLLEAARQACPESPFVHMSTNKVYGDAPNRIALKELETRWDYADAAYENGIAEDFTIDQSKHSLFGASKVAADVMVQEYGRYFGLPTCCLRGGCLTGPNHSGVELHGFLSYLVRCNLEKREYKVFGYKGKQVRDNIHSLDVARFMAAFVASPRQGEVYNLGGGKANSTSILEAFAIAEKFTGVKQVYTYVDQNRIGDHICYYSDLRKMRAHYPSWNITQSLEDTIRQIVESWGARARHDPGGSMIIFSSGLGGHHESYLLAQIRHHRGSGGTVYLPAARQSANAMFRREAEERGVLLLEPRGRAARWLADPHGRFNLLGWACHLAGAAFNRRGEEVYITYVNNAQLLIAVLYQSMGARLRALHFRLQFPDLPGSSPRAWLEKAIIQAFLHQGGRLLSFDPVVVNWSSGMRLSGRAGVLLSPDPISIVSDPSPHWPARERAVRFLVFGSIDRRKGIETLVAALAALPALMRERIELCVAGPSKADFDAEWAALLETHASSGLRFTRVNGWINSDLAQSFFVGVDVVSLLYDGHVGMSSVLVRACAAGCRVLAWNHGLIARVCRSLGTAILVEDARALPDALAHVLSGPGPGLGDIAAARRFASFHTDENYAAATLGGTAPGEGAII